MASVTFKVICRILKGKHFPVSLFVQLTGTPHVSIRICIPSLQVSKTLRVLPVSDIICDAHVWNGYSSRWEYEKTTQYSGNLASQTRPVSGQSNDVLPASRLDYLYVQYEGA